MRAREIQAPSITGFGYLEHLGSGGFADVFLYEQQRPSRKVAVKVMLAERLTEQARAQFDTEADLMALLSNHANIVTMYQADITADGRPFLVMEYCPRANLGVRYKREQLSVVEALSIGIQIAGAVETVHRAGILHRDIKPANILVTEYNRPVLTDFGISVSSAQAERAEGLSIPWSPPEAIADPTGTTTAADIYSLAATIYSLLAGRHPFEVPGGDNRQHAIIARIESSPLPRLARADVPASLEQVLVTGMAKHPSSRYSSALALARALQQVQVELRIPMTAIDVREDVENTRTHLDDEDEPGTRIRSITAIDPTPSLPSAWTTAGSTTAGSATVDGATRPRPPAPPVGGPSFVTQAPSSSSGWSAAASTPAGPTFAGAAAPACASDRQFSTLSRSLASEEVPADTVYRLSVPGPALEAEPEAEPRPTRARLVVWIVSAVVLLGAAAGVIIALSNSGEPEAQEAPTQEAAPVDALAVVVSPVSELAGVSTDYDVTFTWANPDGTDGDVYLWRPTDGVTNPDSISYQSVDAESVTMPRDTFDEGASEMCIEIVVRRSDGTASEPTEGCVAS